MTAFLTGLINQGLIHGPKIPQYAQNVGRAIQKSKIPQYAQNLQNYMFGQTPQWFANKLTGTKFQPNIKGGALANILNPVASSALVQDPSLIAQEAKGFLKLPEEVHDVYSEKTLRDKINDLFDKDIFETKKVKKKKKKKKERLKSKEKQRKLKKKPSTEEGWHIPEHDADGGLIEMKKGGHARKKKKGYAKKQRKRKHYMASGFVKMKKKKKYIT